MSTFFGILLLGAVMAVVLAIYFVPALNAYGRGHNNRTAILLCNLLLGWTFLGWVISLVWSATGNVTRTPLVDWLENEA